MITREELISIGHYNKPHGVASEISATVDVDVDLLSGLTCLVSEMDGIFVPFFVNACRVKSSETVLLTIDGIGNEAEAALLVNHEIYALKRDYEQELEDADADALPLDYFIGFSVQDVSGAQLGEITDVDEQTENALFIVDHDGDAIMLPANEDFIVEFDLEKRVMVMDLPQGLLDLNN